MLFGGLYLQDEPFTCGDTLYQPGARDGYWWASCLVGMDPERPANRPMTADRRAELEAACASVGLLFGSVKRG